MTNVLTPTQITEHSFPLSVEGINDNDPVVDLNGDHDGIDYSTNFTEEGVAVPLSNRLLVTDKDIQPNTLIVNATIKVVDSYPEDVVYVDVTGSGLSATGQGTGMVIITGHAVRSVYQSVLGTATYQNTADEPSSNMKYVKFQVHDADGRYSPIATAHVTILRVCDLLTLKLDYNSSTYNTTFSEMKKTPVRVVNDTHFNILDDDSTTIQRGTITIVGFQEGFKDRLRVLHNSPGVTTSYENGQLIFEGTASFSEYISLITSVYYDNSDPCPPFLYVSLEFNFIDGCGAHNLPASTMIRILAANDPPSVDLDTRTSQDPLEVTYQFQGIDNRNPQPLTLFPNASLTDCDTVDSMESLYIELAEAGDLETHEEMLIFDLVNKDFIVTNTTDNFQVTYWVRPAQGITFRPEDFEMVLRKVWYINSATSPFETTRELTVRASDGTATSEVKGRIVMERIPLRPKVTLGQ